MTFVCGARIKPRALPLLGKCFTTKLFPGDCWLYFVLIIAISNISELVRGRETTGYSETCGPQQFVGSGMQGCWDTVK